MKLAAVVIAYKYTNFELYCNIKYYIEHIDLLIIWDNTPSYERLLTREYWESRYDKTILLGTGRNEGIGYGLNRAAEIAIDRGFEYLLTMDQDSVWKDFLNYKEAVERCLNDKVGIYAPTIASANSGLIFKCNKENLYAITSGSIVNLRIWYEIGRFNERFIIDEVDNEYCIRLVKRGYCIHILKEYLYQRFGYPNENKSLLRISTPNYSPFRIFHQMRNRIWMIRLYHKELSWRYIAYTIIFVIGKRLITIMFFEGSKISKINAMLKGIWYGLIQKCK